MAGIQVRGTGSAGDRDEGLTEAEAKDAFGNHMACPLQPL